MMDYFKPFFTGLTCPNAQTFMSQHEHGITKVRLSPPSTASLSCHPTHLIFDWVGGILLLLALFVWPADVQILHVSGQNLGHADA